MFAGSVLGAVLLLETSADGSAGTLFASRPGSFAGAFLPALIWKACEILRNILSIFVDRVVINYEIEMRDSLFIVARRCCDGIWRRAWRKGRSLKDKKDASRLSASRKVEMALGILTTHTSDALRVESREVVGI